MKTEVFTMRTHKGFRELVKIVKPESMPWLSQSNTITHALRKMAYEKGMTDEEINQVLFYGQKPSQS